MGTVTVGCPENYGLSIMRQPGTMTGLGNFPPAVGPLGEIVSVQWRRVRSDTAAATVFVKGCGLNDRVLIKDGQFIDPWGYELVIHRDSQVAHMGPIMDVIWHSDRGEWEINSNDVMAWPIVREIQPDYTSPFADAATIMQDLIKVYFNDNGDDPDLYRHVILAGTASVPFNVFYKTATFSVMDKMRDLINAGGNFAVVGRTVLIFGDSPPNLANPMIVSAGQLSGAVRLFKTGRSPFGVHAVGRGQELTFGIGPTAADELRFGKVSRITQFTEIQVQAELDALTTAWYNTVSEMRHDIDISGGALLGPETMFYGGTDLLTGSAGTPGYALDFLIPGYRYDVAVTQPDFPIKSAFPMLLDELTVDWTPAAGEQVKASFVSLGREQT